MEDFVKYEHMRLDYYGEIDEIRSQAEELKNNIDMLLAKYIIDCKEEGEEFINEDLILDYIGYIQQFEEVYNLLEQIP